MSPQPDNISNELARANFREKMTELLVELQTKMEEAGLSEAQKSYVQSRVWQLVAEGEKNCPGGGWAEDVLERTNRIEL